MNARYDPEMYVGIDVSKHRLDIAIGQEGDIWEAPNTISGIKKTISRLHSYNPLLVVVVSTGGLEKPLIRALQDTELPVCQVHPGRVRKFASGVGRLAKTDRIDARILAHFGFAAFPKPKPKQKPACEALSALIRRRNQIIEMLTAERNRYFSCPAALRQSIEEHIEWLISKRNELTQQIESMLSSEPDFQEKNAVLRSAKGVGPILSATLQAELPELGQYSHKQISALVGVAPFSKDSGQSSGKQFIQGGRTIVRSTLYLATLSAIRHNPVIHAYYDHLLDRGKLPMVAIVACMHKLIVILNAMVRDMQPWNYPDKFVVAS